MSIGLFNLSLNLFSGVYLRRPLDQADADTRAALDACGMREKMLLREFYLRDRYGATALWLPEENRLSDVLLCKRQVSKHGVYCSLTDRARNVISCMAQRFAERPVCDNYQITWGDVVLDTPRLRVEMPVRMRWWEIGVPLGLRYGAEYKDARPEWFYRDGRILNYGHGVYCRDPTIYRFGQARLLAEERGEPFTSARTWAWLPYHMLTLHEKLNFLPMSLWFTTSKVP